MNKQPIGIALKKRVELSLRAFDSLSKSIGVGVKILKTDEGQFVVIVENDAKEILISHSWGNKAWSYDNPNTIDILLEDKKNQLSYVIYMTECDIALFPNLLSEAYEITNKFLRQEYDSEPAKKFSLVKADSIVFDDAGITYRYATKLKNYVTIKSVLAKRSNNS
jgi:hypothetical protein